MLKAASGGGGRGMRIVYDDSQFATSAAAAASEAQTAFADSTLLLEKYIASARHIEAQILCDHHGTVQVFGLRDCSMQRRRQKIIEESPPPNLSPAIAKQLHTAATTLAKNLQYRNAGTVEFLLSDNHYYFLEINARLQVEHPISEIIYDVDLVEWQLRIADDEALPPLPTPQKLHAIEARLCAENPLNNFLPDVGDVRCVMPTQHKNVRVDSGLYDNGHLNNIGGNYDSMLAKIIAYGKTREEARQILRHALSQTHLCGIANNAAFLSQTLATTDFAKARITTEWADNNTDNIILQLHNQKLQAAYLTAVWKMQTGTLPADAVGLRLFASPQSRIVLYDGAEMSDINICKNADNFICKNNMQSDATPMQINISDVVLQSPTTAEKLGATMQMQAKINDAIVCIQFASHHRGIDVFYQGMHLQFCFAAPPSLAKNQQLESQVYAPMQSTVRKVCVRAKQKVKSGEVLFLLEAMKMEIAVHAPRDGTIAQVLCAVNNTVTQGELLASLHDDSQPRIRRAANSKGNISKVNKRKRTS